MTEELNEVPTSDPIVNEAKKRFMRCSEWESASRQRFIDDYRFANGDSDNGYQWPDSIRRNRDTDSRPCLTMNIIKQHNLQISNEARKNKSQGKVLPTGGGATIESALAMQDMVRHIENRSNAQPIYTTARGFQIDGGIGWWRIATDYVDDNTFDQEILLRPVNDPLSVFMDPDIDQKSGSDARFAFVFDNVPRDLWKENYPEFADLVGHNPMGVGSSDSDWVSENSIRIAEYFRKTFVVDRLFSFVLDGQRKNLRESYMTPEMVEEISADKLTKVRPIKVEQIEWHLIAGNQIVDSTIWPGKYIPLIRCIGEEVVIDGILDRKGHTRAMKDPQRMLNYNAALDVSTPVPTPFGWTTMGKLQDGDLVFDHNGNPVEVAKALPIRENEECFEIEFDDGHKIVTDAGHIWQVEERGKRTAAGTTWISKTVSTAELRSKDHFISIAAPLKTDEINLPIDPYVLGTWLGDGHAASARISAHVDDVEEQRSLIQECGYTTGEPNNEVGLGVTFNIFGLREQLREAGLANDKHVPFVYLRSSPEQRLSLLQGLMDTDGHYAKAVNQCIFVNGNVNIVKAVLELCASLGIKATISLQSESAKESGRKVYISKKTYRVQFTARPTLPVFRLSRKLNLQTQLRAEQRRRAGRIGIVAVRKVESRPVRCITLDTPEHLYLVGRNMIPTHNSAQVEFVALQGKTPWIAPAKAIEEYESMWNTANAVNHSVLIWNNRDDEGNEIPPPQRTQPPTASPAYEVGMQTAFNQVMMVSGQWQNQMGMMGNERTGKAIALRQHQSDTATFHFQDNYEEALRFSTVQLIDLIPKIYDTRRVISIMGDDGQTFEMQIDPAAQQAYAEQMAKDGFVATRIFNPQMGMYDVAPGIGPAFGTKAEETAEALTLLLTQAPALVPVVGDLLLGSMSFDKAQEAAVRLRRMVPPQALGTGPSPNEQQLQQVVASLQKALAESLQRQGKAEIQLAGRAQLRQTDVFKAQTERMSALKDFLPANPQGLEALIRQIVGEALGTSLKPVIDANANNLDIDGPGGIPEARRAADGKHYIPDERRPGKFLLVEKRQ